MILMLKRRIVIIMIIIIIKFKVILITDLCLKLSGNMLVSPMRIICVSSLPLNDCFKNVSNFNINLKLDLNY